VERCGSPYIKERGETNLTVRVGSGAILPDSTGLGEGIRPQVLSIHLRLLGSTSLGLEREICGFKLKAGKTTCLAPE
jgi:hypothetical protein